MTDHDLAQSHGADAVNALEHFRITGTYDQLVDPVDVVSGPRMVDPDEMKDAFALAAYTAARAAGHYATRYQVVRDQGKPDWRKQ